MLIADLKMELTPASGVKLEFLAAGMRRLVWGDPHDGIFVVFNGDDLVAWLKDKTFTLHATYPHDDWSVYRASFRWVPKNEEAELCCADVCHWCKMHRQRPDANGPAERLVGERAYSHLIKISDRYEHRAWCNATAIRERLGLGPVVQPSLGRAKSDEYAPTLGRDQPARRPDGSVLND